MKADALHCGRGWANWDQRMEVTAGSSGWLTGHETRNGRLGGYGNTFVSRIKKVKLDVPCDAGGY